MKSHPRPDRAMLLPAIDATGRAVAHWLEPLGASGEVSPVLRDFLLLRSVTAITRKDQVQAIVLPVAWTTLATRGDHYLRVLQTVACTDWCLCLEIEVPQRAHSLAELVRFAATCRERRVGLGLKLHAAELPIGPSLARATAARHVQLAPDCWRWLAAMASANPAATPPSTPSAVAAPRLRAQLDAFRSDRRVALVARADAPETLALARQSSPDWLLGLAVAGATIVHHDGRGRGSAGSCGAHGAARRAGRAVGASIGAVIALTACSSAPQPAVPDGSSRVPVNDPARLARLTQATRAQTEVLAERSALYQQVSGLRRQVQDLRTVVKLLLEAKQGEGAGQPPGALPLATPLAASGTLGSTLAPRSVEPVPGGMVFRVFQPFSVSRFEPAPQADAGSTVFEQALRQAARDATAIEVCGFTDSPVADDGNRHVAWARAHEARRWLLAQGVDASRIRTRFEPAGHFLADNRDEAGRAQNRRVELVFRGDMRQAAAIINRRQG